jgi:CheY-like chemotaxis protein
MGGSITVESKYNEGTTFIFTIQSVISLKSLRTYVTNELSGIEGKQVLIVDDNSTNRSILKNQLEKWKLVSILASSGKEAIEILQSNKYFDLVLSDMQMPEMDGCELAEQIKLIQPAIPIILLSSVGDEYYKKYNHLFKAILTKPIKQEMLSKLIINELRGKLSVPQPSSSLKNMLSVDFAQSYPLHILVAEDNVINQKLILMVLSKLGYKADLAENGKRAVDMLSEGNYNLVFMDMQMPEMDGIEATQIIRNQAGYQPKIIAMTANAMKEDKEECLKAGMDDFLSKPVMLNDLKNMLVLWATAIKAGK